MDILTRWIAEHKVFAGTLMTGFGFYFVYCISYGLGKFLFRILN